MDTYSKVSAGSPDAIVIRNCVLSVGSVSILICVPTETACQKVSSMAVINYNLASLWWYFKQWIKKGTLLYISSMVRISEQFPIVSRNNERESWQDTKYFL